ncbi:MAG: serine/threonine-protein kinase [Nannocystaceae bacterium]
MTRTASSTPPAVDSASVATLIDDEPAVRFDPGEALSRGTAVGRYVILERIGAGGMGVVYSAYDRDLDRRVAIKLLRSRPHRDRSKGQARLIREAQAMARLAHPNVVAVHEVGIYGDQPFVAMEFIDGQTLGAWLDETRRPWKEIVAVLLQAGRGLAAAHAQGLVHRDFKPDNVLVGHDGRARVLDFGLARPTGDLSSENLPLRDELPSGSGSISLRLTETGALAGTPAYMAAEQYRGLAPDARSDQFAFCVTAWEALYGERPFHGDNQAQLAMAVCTGELRDPTSRDVPAFLRRALRRGLARKPDQRFGSMDELLAELGRDPVRTRKRWLAAGLAAVSIAASSALVARWSGGTEDPCGAGPQRLATAWGQDRERELAEAFARVDALFAQTSLGTVKAELRHYAERWTTSYRDACEATHLRHEQSTALLDRRMACLERRRSSLDATTSLLARADREAIARSIQAVAALPSIDECDDAERMMARFAAPSDPAVSERVLALGTRLAHASAQGMTGHAEQGLTEALKIEEQAVELGYAPLDAEIALTLGELSYQVGRPHQALRWFHEAVDEAVASGHDEVLATATTKLVSIVGVSLSHYEEAERWGRLAEAAVRRRGRDMDDTIDLALGMCMMLADKGDAASALPHCREGLELSIARHGPEHSATGRAYRALGNAHYSAADYSAAAEAYERATELFLSSHGVDHPDYPALLNSLAAVCHSQGRGEACTGLFEQTVDAAVRSYGPEHPAVADFTNNLAIALYEQGRLAEAETQAQRSLQLRRAKFGDDHPGVGAAHRVLARIATDRGDLLLALDHAQRAVSILRQTRGADHPDVLEALTVRAEVRMASDDERGGLEDWEAALAMVVRLDRPPLQRAHIRFSLAQALFGRGDEARVRSLAAAAQDEAGDDPLAEQIAQWRAGLDDPGSAAERLPPPR